MRKVNGIKVGKVTRREPGNGLPPWVRQRAATRGYADALEPLSLYVNEKDVRNAYDCVAQGNGAKCVMAQAGRRLGAEAVYFYRTTAWIDFGEGPIVRFQTTKSIYNNIIEPFDRGDFEAIAVGHYPLTPPAPSKTLEAERARSAKTGKRINSGERKIVSHTERVVMAPHE